jgi:hypothetical protein
VFHPGSFLKDCDPHQGSATTPGSEGNFCSDQIAAKIPCQICLRCPHGTVDGSVVVAAFIGFMIAVEINPDEPSAVASCDDLANFASHRDFLLGSAREAHFLHAQWMAKHLFIGY